LLANITPQGSDIPKSLANKGWKAALSENPGLSKGLNVHNGQITYKAVAQAHGMASVEMDFLP